MDEIPANRAFAEKFDITFPLICDTSGEVCDAFDVAHPDNKPARETFLFEDGRLVYRYYVTGPQNQAQDILTLVELLEARNRQ